MGTAPTVLVVEDEPLVAMVLEEMLSDLGCAVVGPVDSVEESLRLVAAEKVDAAILDLLLKGASSWPVAEALRKKHIPFALATGWSFDRLDPQWACCPKLQKPYQLADLKATVDLLTTRSGSSQSQGD